jgi:hypothetical protein
MDNAMAFSMTSSYDSIDLILAEASHDVKRKKSGKFLLYVIN